MTDERSRPVKRLSRRDKRIYKSRKGDFTTCLQLQGTGDSNGPFVFMGFEDQIQGS